MLDSAIVETVVGLVFVFYATALVCSGVVEMIANWTKKRAKYLLRGLRELLDDPGANAEDMGRAAVKAVARGDEAAHYAVALGRQLADKETEARLKELWSTKLVNHPLLKPYKHYNRLGEPTRNPAYLPPSAFALALLDLAGPPPTDAAPADGAAPPADTVPAGNAPPPAEAVPADNVPPRAEPVPADNAPPPAEAVPANNDPAPTHDGPGGNLQQVIGLLRHEIKEPDQLRDSLESWFNGQMDRVTGSYKRWAKRLAIPIALVVALAFNVDTVAVAHSLYTDGAIRSAVLDVAASGNVCPTPAAGQPAATNCLNATVAGLRELKLPIGWSGQRLADLGRLSMWGLITKLFGLLLTVAGASLGAPFWFDLLNRFGSLRNVGTKPTSTS